MPAGVADTNSVWVASVGVAAHGHAQPRTPPPCVCSPCAAWPSRGLHGAHGFFLKSSRNILFRGSHNLPSPGQTRPHPRPENSRKLFAKHPCVPCKCYRGHTGHGLQTHGGACRAVRGACIRGNFRRGTPQLPP